MFEMATFYRFAQVGDPARLRARLADELGRLGVRGTVIVAGEGLNGTIAGVPSAVAGALAAIRAEPGFAPVDARIVPVTVPPFGRLKLKLKSEIVRMGVPGIHPEKATGRHVGPKEWSALLADPDTVVIDTRNAFEVAMGTFPGAIDPGTRRFGDFPAWWDANAERFGHRRIAMFCTGGIRCEKAAAYLLARGTNEVCQLQGGILGYLDAVPVGESLWRGACFVFDERERDDGTAAA